MTDVFLLYHVHQIEGSQYIERLLIGTYTTQASARGAIERLKDKSGFRDHPDGWQVISKTVDEDDWTEGFDPKTHEKS